MFQTFSGSSRRPRQVNLSGQNVNPFAVNPFGASASGTQKTVAHAQQERQQRQRERERLNASKRIQRVWRGHRVRKELAESRRFSWDSVEAQGSGRDVSVEQLRLLVAFFDSRRKDDLQRLITLSLRIANVGFEVVLGREGVQPLLARLAHVTVDALQT
jgi:ubiquitin-protein ligase E3 C